MSVKTWFKENTPYWLQETGTQLFLHVPQSMLTFAPVVFMPGAWKILGGFISAFLCFFWREDSQHRKVFDATKEGWRWPLKGFPLGGRWRDMWAGAVGGAVDAAIWYFTLGRAV